MKKLLKLAPKVVQKVAAIKSLKGKIETDSNGFFSLKDYPDLIDFFDLNGDGKVNIKDLHDASWKGMVKIAVGLVIVALIVMGSLYFSQVLEIDLL